MYDRTLIGLVPSFHTKATPSSPSESVDDAVIAKFKKDVLRSPNMSSTKVFGECTVVYTADSVIVRAPVYSGATIEFTVDRDDLLRVYQNVQRGVPRGLPSSATLNLAPL
jgi:hypothetical protein